MRTAHLECGAQHRFGFPHSELIRNVNFQDYECRRVANNMIPETIRQQLDQIDELFPPARLAMSRERWTRLWRGQAPLDRYPFVFAPYCFNYYAAGETPEERLRTTLDEIIVRGILHDDFIPAFFPGCRQSTIPTMFGAEEVVLDGDYSCRRVADSLADFDHLPAPSLGPDTVAGAWLAMQAYVLEATDGRLPVHVTDMQGPADVGGQLLGYDALLAGAYEDPDRYHRFMAELTDAFILFWAAQQRLCGDRFVGTHLFGWDWAPADAGATLSADSLVMISPAFYQEFYQPYLQRIGEAFGGLAVHSCGDFSAVIPALCATPTVTAVNAGEMSIPALQAAGVDAPTLIIAQAGAETLEDIFPHIAAGRLRVSITINGIWPTTPNGVKPAPAWTPADRDGLRRREERVLALAHDCSPS